MPPRSRCKKRHQIRRALLAALAASGTLPSLASGQGDAQGKRLEGVWGGELVHKGERTEIYVAFVPGNDGTLRARLSLPAINFYDLPLGRAAFDGTTVRFASLAFDYDAATDRLRGALPAELAPVYKLATTLTRRARVERRPRAALDAPVRAPLWVVELGTPVWADLTAAHGLVYVGGDDGRLRALDARDGTRRWEYACAGALRCGATVAADRLFVTSDDGVLHCIGARDARPIWQVRVNRSPTARLPPSDPKSKYDPHGAAVTVVRDAVFAGTHEGRVLALDASDGAIRWSFACGDRILAAPFVGGDVVLIGCYDGKVYALDARSGALRWSFDTRAPVTSTPVLVQDVVVVGSRSYDLWGLDVRSGKPRWNRYVWFSWIESNAAIAGRTAYVGSSDAAKVFAFDAPTGRRIWETDVHGYAWRTPLVDGAALYLGTRGEATANDHRAHALALDRATGKVLWRYPFPAADPKINHGFAAGAASAGDRLYLASLDGRLHAFATR